MARHVEIVALYALAVGVVVGLFVPVLTMRDPATLLILTGVITFVVALRIALLYELRLESGEDVEDLEPGRGRPLLVPFAMAAVARAPAILVPEYERETRTEFSGVSPHILEATVPILSLAAVVFVALPLAARHNAWQRVGTVTVNSANDGEPLPEESSEKGISAAFDVTVPDRVEVVEFDAKKPAIYVVDDGRRAVIGFTSGALYVLSDRELDAVVAREVARLVERAAVGPFWASALAHAVGDVLDLVTTESLTLERRAKSGCRTGSSDHSRPEPRSRECSWSPRPTSGRWRRTSPSVACRSRSRTPSASSR